MGRPTSTAEDSSSVTRTNKPLLAVALVIATIACAYSIISQTRPNDYTLTRVAMKGIKLDINGYLYHFDDPSEEDLLQVIRDLYSRRPDRFRDPISKAPFLLSPNVDAWMDVSDDGDAVIACKVAQDPVLLFAQNLESAEAIVIRSQEQLKQIVPWLDAAIVPENVSEAN